MARQRWFVAVLAIGLFAAACKDKKKEDGKGGTGTGAAPTEKGGEAKKPDAPASAKDDLSLIPVDSEAVFGVNWGQLQSSSLWKKVVEPEMRKDDDFIANLGKFKERCGFDPMTTVTKLSIGMKGLGSDMPDGVMVVHGLDKQKTLACSEKWNDDLAKEKVAVKRDGDIVTFIDDTNAGVGITFIGGDRALVVMGQGVNADSVKKAAQGGSTLSTSPSFVDMHGKITKDQSVWFLMNGTSKIFEDAAQMGLRPKAVFGSINVTDGLAADIRARLDSADQATQTVSSFKGQLASMASMFDKLDLTSDGADVKLVAAASKDKLDELVKTFGGM